MIIFRQIDLLQQHLHFLKNSGKSTGFVPTMGALHKGHESLVAAARKNCDITICSIFVNPAQFNDKKDFERYPHTIDKDIYLLEKAGCDILFMPPVEEMYPEGLRESKKFNLGYLETVLEGASRPGHFQGVCRVVEKLLTIVEPGKLFLGQKDFQQCMVIKKLITWMNVDISVTVCPTLREQDGLAMSSRNLRLDEAGRSKASHIYKTLEFVKQHIQPGNITGLKQQAVSYLETHGFTVDYIQIADAATLQLINEWDGKIKLVVLTAAFINDIRLIDNILL